MKTIFEKGSWLTTKAMRSSWLHPTSFTGQYPIWITPFCKFLLYISGLMGFSTTDTKAFTFVVNTLSIFFFAWQRKCCLQQHRNQSFQISLRANFTSSWHHVDNAFSVIYVSFVPIVAVWPPRQRRCRLLAPVEYWPPVPVEFWPGAFVDLNAANCG